MDVLGVVVPASSRAQLRKPGWTMRLGSGILGCTTSRPASHTINEQNWRGIEAKHRRLNDTGSATEHAHAYSSCRCEFVVSPRAPARPAAGTLPPRPATFGSRQKTQPLPSETGSLGVREKGEMSIFANWQYILVELAMRVASPGSFTSQVFTERTSTTPTSSFIGEVGTACRTS